MAKAAIIAAVLSIPLLGGLIVHAAAAALSSGGTLIISASLAGTILAIKRHG